MTSCESNCKNIGTALEMYSTDNGGHYPRSMSQLLPHYLKVVPSCPAAGRDTYSSTLRVVVSGAKSADGYSFYCRGANHTGVGISGDFPQYNSVQGLISGH